MKNIEELIAEQLAEQRKTNELLKSLVEAQSGTALGKMSVEDEIRMVRASGQDLIAYLKNRGKEERSGNNPPSGRRKINTSRGKRRVDKQRI
jgi:hypothetical protein